MLESELFVKVMFTLAAGSYDNKIVMWDIGGIDIQYNFKVV